MAKVRTLAAALAALPLVAVGCGGGAKSDAAGNPFGLSCRIHVSGPGVSEDMWCIVAAYDYMYGPAPGWVPQAEWGFELTAYRPNLMDVGAGVGVFLNGPPTLGTAYGWDGSLATSGLDGGGASRYTGSVQAGTSQQTHDASSVAGTGSLTVRFTEIPPPGAQQQAILVHGSLTGTVEPMGAGTTLTIRATF